MDIVKEISRLPNFGYVFWGDDGRVHIAVLSGHSAKKSDSYEWSDSILRTSSAMQKLYEQTELSVDDKKELARLMQKMYSLCETRKVGLFTMDEQEKYLNERSEDELKQIEQQVKMHLDCGTFYRDYIYGR